MPKSQVSKLAGPPGELLLPGHAARVLGVTTTTLAGLANAGEVESITLPSGHRRYVAASVEALADRRGRAVSA